MKRIYLFFLAIALSQSAFAGWVELTHHSRANCINNESISWHRGNSYWLWVNSEHYDAKTGVRLHYVLTGWQFTWRAAAVHYGEGMRGGYKVHGTHWMPHPRTNVPRIVAEEWVWDCSIYDGWWDV